MSLDPWQLSAQLRRTRRDVKGASHPDCWTTDARAVGRELVELLTRQLDRLDEADRERDRGG